MSFIGNKIRSRLYGGDVKRMIASDKIPDAFKSLERMKKLGFTPRSVFDVGAYQGDFTAMCLDLWPDCEIHSFEALPEKLKQLQSRFKNKKVRIVGNLVGDEQKDVQFFADETASSILESQEFTPKKKLNLRMITLDHYVSQNNLPAPNLLKIDTQGYEYPILQGFGKNLEKVEALLLELNFIEIYHKVTLAHKIIQYLSEFGFVVYDICEIHRRPLDRALIQMDFLFVKESSHLRKDKRWDEDHSR